MYRCCVPRAAQDRSSFELPLVSNSRDGIPTIYLRRPAMQALRRHAWSSSMTQPVSFQLAPPSSARFKSGLVTHAAESLASETTSADPSGPRSLDFSLWHERLFVTPADLIQLTGCRRRSNQISWLNKMKIPFVINECDEPVVLTAVLLRHFKLDQPQQAPRWESNYKPGQRRGGQQRGR